MMKPAGEMREILLKLADAVISNVTDCILHSDDFDKIVMEKSRDVTRKLDICLLYTSPSPRDRTRSRMPSSA